MSSDATAASGPNRELIARLRQSLRTGTALDLQGAVIPADLLRAALIGQPYGDELELVIPVADIDPRGLRIENAEVHGHLDLTHAAISPAVTITHSSFADGIDLNGARLTRELNLSESVISWFQLIGTAIVGQLIMRGAQLTGTNQHGDSLVGDGLQVDGNAVLDGGFTAAGAVRLLGARITGQLNMRGAQLTGTNQDGRSLVADRLQVDSDAILDDGFTAAGTVRLAGAHITGQLNMRGAQLTGTNQHGDSLVADRLQVDSDAVFDDGFTAAGTVRLLGARITGQLTMRDAQLTGTNQGGHSLAADGLRVDGGAFLDGAFTAAGTVRLSGARITGGLFILGTSIRATTVDSPGLELAGASIDDPQIDLLRDDWINEPRVQPDPKTLPSQRVMLSLENFTYKHRPDPQIGDVETWLRVLRFHTPGYQPRSYQQLAAVHRATGHDRDAARILMAQQDHRRAVALRPQPGTRRRHKVGLWLSRVGLGFWKATLGYGYRPRRALGWLLALLAIAGILITAAAHWQADPGVPDVPVASRPGNPTIGTPAEYCSFGEAAGLAVRIAIPLVTNLGQGACVVNTATTPGSIIVAISIGLQTFAWILGGLTIAAAATAIKRSP